MQKPTIQYVHASYIYGSEARALEQKNAKKKRGAQLPQVSPSNKIRILVDPVAVCGIAVAIVMILLMAVGVNQYLGACYRYEAMTDYVIELQNENIRLHQEYESSYDLENIREQAVALGMMPKAEAQIITIHPVIPEPAAQRTLLGDIRWFLEGLFA